MYFTNTDTTAIINAIDRNTDKLLAVLTDTTEDCAGCPLDECQEHIEVSFRNIGEETQMRVYSKTISDHCMTRFAAGTSGYHGGDACHGCESIIEIEDLGCTDLHIETTNNAVRIIMGGDRELDHLIEGLRFMADMLEENIDANYPGRYEEDCIS